MHYSLTIDHIGTLECAFIILVARRSAYLYTIFSLVYSVHTCILTHSKSPCPVRCANHREPLRSSARGASAAGARRPELAALRARAPRALPLGHAGHRARVPHAVPPVRPLTLRLLLRLLRRDSRASRRPLVPRARAVALIRTLSRSCELARTSAQYCWCCSWRCSCR